MTDNAESLTKLKRKRMTKRSNATRFINQLHGFNTSSILDEVGHFYDRLRETLEQLTILDNAIHDLCDDTEYEADVQTCEAYIERCKWTIRKTKNLIEQCPPTESSRNAAIPPHQSTS